MIERFKTILLVGLIGLSIYLTYLIWFGSPYLEEGMLPRFEYAYFTPLPPPELLLPPAKAILERAGAQEIYYFRRGTRELEAVWKDSFRFLSRELPVALGERLGETELAKITETALFTLQFVFNPPLPESFLWGRRAFPGELSSVYLLKGAEEHYVLLVGEDKVLYRLQAEEENFLEGALAPFLDQQNLRAEKLPEQFVLQIVSFPDGSGETAVSLHLTAEEAPQEAEEAAADAGEGTTEGSGEEGEEETPGGEEAAAAAEPGAEEESREPGWAGDPPLELNGAEEPSSGTEAPVLEQWQITVPQPLYIPGKLEAREISLVQETLPRKDLVHAFFLDPAMARRIEERDGAIYYTDGKKGLRLYAGGALEYTAPGLEVFPNRLSYASALLQAAENQCLYGGWPAGTFLERREKTSAGYRFFWRSYFYGLPLLRTDSSCEMLVNDKGMPYYRRNFYLYAGEARGVFLPFAPYTHALFQVIALHRPLFAGEEATLLAVEPVYRLLRNGPGAGLIAVPAWKVHYAETGPVYLHWYTLKPL